LSNTLYSQTDITNCARDSVSCVRNGCLVSVKQYAIVITEDVLEQCVICNHEGLSQPMVCVLAQTYQAY